MAEIKWTDLIPQFPTQYHPHERQHVNSGSRMKTLYAPRFNENGQMELVENGEEDLYQYIQSHADSVDINVLLKRFANGEYDVLSRVQGAFGDFTGLPTTYADLLNSVNQGHELFDSLPVEVRARFHHNFAEFMAAMDRPDFLELIGVKPAEPAPAPAPDVEKEGDVSES